MATLTTSPIWRDTYYVNNLNSAKFRIVLDGENIYSGKAVKYPDAGNLEINVNKVCRNYLESDIAQLLSTMPSTTTSYTHPYGQRTFQLYVNDSNVADYRFYQDYSYTSDKPTTGTNINISNPINGHYVLGMLKVKTTRTSNGSTSSVITQGSASSYAGLGYETRVKCTPYVLYYHNSYGGWDAFVIEGNVIKKDNYTTYTTDQVYKNFMPEFETNKYVNEIKTSYELNTNYLTDEQSDNLAKNLIGSIKVYLQNIEEGWVKPVIITDNSVTYQTYQGNNRKMAQYKINVTESQSKIRR